MSMLFDPASTFLGCITHASYWVPSDIPCLQRSPMCLKLHPCKA